LHIHGQRNMWVIRTGTSRLPGSKIHVFVVQLTELSHGDIVTVSGI